MSLDSFIPAQHSVLIVDDTLANRRLYGALLEKAGFAVRLAESGPKALRFIEEEPPSLVLLDYMMPDMDGVQVLQELRQRDLGAKLPVVMLTASAEPDHIDAALGAGANDYITKPVNGKILIARVRSMIRADQSRERYSTRGQTSALIAELEEAARVQQAQLPTVPMRFRDFRITGAVLPSGQVGGDIFDLIQTEDGRFVAALLDVSGHGTASALVAAETRAEFRNLLLGRSLAEAFTKLNSHMARRQTGKYSCLAAVELLSHQVLIINAGLPPVLVLRGSCKLASIAGSGTPVGMFEDGDYEVSEVPIQAGDRIVMMSDGVTEPFGMADDSSAAVDRLQLWPTVRDDVPTPDQLRARISRFNQGTAPRLLDDATLVVLHLTGSVHETMKLAARPDAIPRAVRWVVDQAPAWADADSVNHGLTEALTNAVLHGALGLGSEMRQGSGYDEYLQLAHELPDRPGFLDRHVELTVMRSPDVFAIRIRWEGIPCAPEDRQPEPSPAALLTSGMGTRIIFSLFDRVEWEEDGLGLELWLHNAKMTLPPVTQAYPRPSERPEGNLSSLRLTIRSPEDEA